MNGQEVDCGRVNYLEELLTILTFRLGGKYRSLKFAASSIDALGEAAQGEIIRRRGYIAQITRLVSPHYFPNCLPDLVGEFSWIAIGRS